MKLRDGIGVTAVLPAAVGRAVIAASAILTGSCSVLLDFNEGLACADEYPCASGYACVGERCRKLNDDGTLDLSGPPELVFETAEIVSDTNGDDVLSPGETGYLKITIQNAGGDESPEVEANLTTTNGSVTITNGNGLRFGNVGGRATACGVTSTNADYGGYCNQYYDDYPSFEVDKGVAVGTIIPFSLALTDTYANTFSLQFNYTVQAIDQVLVVAATTVLSDTNGDDVVSPGETGFLKVQLQNTGDSKALDLRADLTTTNGSVVITNGNGLRFGNVGGGATACGVTSANADYGGHCNQYFDDYPSFEVDKGVAVDTIIPFSLALTDTYGNTFSLQFNYTVQAIDQVLVVAATTVLSDTNGDDVVSPGETGFLKVQLQNTGESKALDVRADLTTINSSVTITNGNGLRFGNVGGGATACGVTSANADYGGYCNQYYDDYPSFEVDTGVGVDTIIPFSLALTDTYGNTFSLGFNYTVRAIDQVFVVSSTTVVHDTNGNGTVSPGETGYLRVQLQNTGDSRALDVRADLTTTNGSVTITNGNGLRFGAVSGGAVACGVTSANASYAGYCNQYYDDYPAFQVDSGVTGGTAIPFSLAITDTYGNAFSLGFNYTVAP